LRYGRCDEWMCWKDCGAQSCLTVVLGVFVCLCVCLYRKLCATPPVLHPSLTFYIATKAQQEKLGWHSPISQVSLFGPMLHELPTEHKLFKAVALIGLLGQKVHLQVILGQLNTLAAHNHTVSFVQDDKLELSEKLESHTFVFADDSAVPATRADSSLMKKQLDNIEGVVNDTRDTVVTVEKSIQGLTSILGSIKELMDDYSKASWKIVDDMLVVKSRLGQKPCYAEGVYKRMPSSGEQSIFQSEPVDGACSRVVITQELTDAADSQTWFAVLQFDNNYPSSRWSSSSSFRLRVPLPLS